MDEQSESIPNEGRSPAGAGGNTASTVIPVIEEQLRVDKKFVETGKVHISKKVSELQTSVSLPLTHEEYDVERVPVNRVVDTPPPAVSYEGDTMIVPVLREVLVVQKKYEIVEEVRLTKKTFTRQETQPVTLLKEEVAVERKPLNRPDHNTP